MINCYTYLFVVQYVFLSMYSLLMRRKSQRKDILCPLTFCAAAKNYYFGQLRVHGLLLILSISCTVGCRQQSLLLHTETGFLSVAFLLWPTPQKYHFASMQSFEPPALLCHLTGKQDHLRVPSVFLYTHPKHNCQRMKY